MQRKLLAATIAATLVSGLAFAYAGYGWKYSLQSSSVAAATSVSTARMAAKDSSTATARPAPTPAPWVTLDIETPRYNKNKDPKVPLMLTGGFPLVFKAVVRPDALGIAMDAQPSDFPNQGETGYVILADPDGCLQLPPPYENAGLPCASNPSDDVYIEFTPDIDQLGAFDDAGNPARSAALAEESISGRPLLLSEVDPTTLPANLVGVGPPTVLRRPIPNTAPTEYELIDVADGYGYGADDDLPGLVVLSDVGVGRVLNPDFNRPAQTQLRNLAGFLNWVGYELVSSTGETKLHAGMVTPDALFSPLMRTDDCISTPASPDSARPCDGNRSWYRVDGGPVIMQPSSAGPGGYQFNFPLLYLGELFQVRAFMVSGTAPSTLTDLDGNGMVDAADATLAGYTVISNVATATFRQKTTRHCGGPWGSNTVFADYDGNGYILPSLVCGAGPGQITRIPD